LKYQPDGGIKYRDEKNFEMLLYEYFFNNSALSKKYLNGTDNEIEIIHDVSGILVYEEKTSIPKIHIRPFF